MNSLILSSCSEQPPLLRLSRGDTLTVAIAGLALGGAERIVLDWAARVTPRWRVHLIVLRDHEKEWPVPSSVTVTRLHGARIIERLKAIGKTIAKSGSPVCLCHLLRETERKALASGGAVPIPVLHNAKQGWLEDGSRLTSAGPVIAVSEACASDLREAGFVGPISVVRHIPSIRKLSRESRDCFRKEWGVPAHATVIGMIGAVKPQKNYPFAIEALSLLLRRKDAYLVILGGPIGKSGREAWQSVLDAIQRLGLRHRVALPGFVPDAPRALSAFDILLNTSEYEGLSMATLEALLAGLPVVASEVGGQGEISSDGLRLIQSGAPAEEWALALEEAIGSKPALPSWSKFPSYRLWTLAAIARPVKPKKGTLFVTANLNSGGAQRSLVNLSKEISGRHRFEVAVAGDSSAPYFYQELAKVGVTVWRSDSSRDCFDHAEAIAAKLSEGRFDTVCFWNLDPKVKLLLVKAYGYAPIRFIDVSPGDNSFDEMESVSEFQKLACFTGREYLERLDRLVLKYRGKYPAAVEGKVSVIPNGIPEPQFVKTDYALGNPPRIVVNGRITPTKFVIEIIGSMDTVWKKFPDAELHFFGAAEPRMMEYAEKAFALAKADPKRRIVFHGLDFEAASKLPEFDAYAVLGKDQGCPNALLEALARGLPAVGNDNGGTKEQIIDNETGLLIGDCSPEELGAALTRLLEDRGLAQRLGRAARTRALSEFSMEKMASAYLRLFTGRNSEKASIGSRFAAWFGELFPSTSNITSETTETA